MPAKIEAYDYRGTLLVKLTSGLVLVHGPATAHSSKRPILAEASNLADAQAWVDTRISNPMVKQQ